MDLYWQKIEEALALSTEMPKAEYELWLAEFCAGDEKLKAEIESLLSFQSTSEDFLEKGVSDYVDKIIPDDGNNLSGKDFGHYKIIREIGAGGMGTVYLAERSDGEFDQQVALKVVRHRFASSDLAKRFRRERQILANLNHPNVARLLDGGVSSEKQSFIVMEYVEGERIDEYCNKNKLSIDERLKLYLSVCAAVAYAHQNLVVHRDIKPSNILVTDEGIPKLLDFGIAKLLDAENTDEQTRTEARAFTPEYASPEQKSGGQITTATDIYSLGVLLSDLLGKRFINSNENTDRRINSDLRSILQMAQRDEPEMRYASVQQFAEDIERYLKGLPVRAQKGSFTYRAGKFIKRNQIAAAAAAIILMSLIVGLTISLWQYRNAERERAKAERIKTFLENMIYSANPSVANGRQGDINAFAAVLENASRQIESEDFASEPLVKANLQQVIGSNYLSIGRYDLAEQNLRAALETQNKLLDENSLEVTKTLAELAALALIKSDYSTAENTYRKALNNLRSEYQNGNVPLTYLINALSNLALVRRARGDSKESETLLREVISFESKATDKEKNLIEIKETLLTLTLVDQAKFNEAQERTQNQIAKLRKENNEETSEMSAILTILGSIQMEKEEFSEAEISLRHGEKIYRKISDPNSMAIHDNLRLQSQNLYMQGKFAEAEKTINLVLENYKLNSSPKYINYATALTIKGLILNKEGNSIEAEQILRQAFQVREENLPKEHFMSALTTGALGEILTSQKRYAEAEPLLLQSYKSLQASQAGQNPRTELAKRRLTELYTLWGKPNLVAELR